MLYITRNILLFEKILFNYNFIVQDLGMFIDNNIFINLNN